MSRDEAFREFESALAFIDKQAREATLKAKAMLHKQLAVIRAEHHEEPKEILK